MVRRLLLSLAFATALVAAGAVAFLRTDFVASNLCSYAVATIEEASKAHVRVASCSVDPVRGTLVIEGLSAADPEDLLQFTAARIFAHVEVRPLQQKLKLVQLEIDHPDLRLLVAPSGRPKPKKTAGACLPEVLDRFELGRVKIRKARVRVELPAEGVKVDVPRASVRIRGEGESLRLSVATRTGTVALPGRSVGLLSLRAQAHLDLRGTGTIELVRGDVIGTEATAYVKGKLFDICNPKVEASANVHVDDLTAAAERLLPGVLRGVKGAVQLDGLVRASAGRLDAHGDVRVKGLELEGLAPGDARASFRVTPEKVTLSKLLVPVGTGDVQGQVEVGIARSELPLTADVSLRAVELAGILGKLGIPRSHVVLRASGRARVHGALAPLALKGEVALDLADFAILDRRHQERANARRLLEFGRGKLTTAVAISAERIALGGAELHIGGSRLEVEADFFTDPRRGMELTGRGARFALAEFRHLGPLPIEGSADLDVRVAGPYGDPTIAGTASLRDFHLLDLSLGDVAATVRFAGLILDLSGIEGRKLASRYSGAVRLDFSAEAMPMEARLVLGDSSRLHDLVDLAVGLVPTLSTVHAAEDVDGGVRGVIHARGPVARPDAFAQLDLSDVHLWGQKFASGEVEIALHGGEKMVIQKLELLHTGEPNSSAFELAGRFGPRWELELDGRTRGFDLADLDSASAAKLTGPLAATVRMRGLSSHPVIDAAMKFTGGKAGKAALGDGAFTLRVDGKAMVAHGTVGPHVFDAKARLLDDFPFTSTVALRFDELAGYLATFAPGSGLDRGAMSADVSLAGSLLRWRQAGGSVQLTRLKVHWTDAEKKAGLEFANDGNGQIAFGPQGIEIKQLRLAEARQQVSASLRGSRASDGRLDFRLSAELDGRLLMAFAQGGENASGPVVEHAAGSARLEAAVGGTGEEPTLLGSLTLVNGELRVRGQPVAVRELNGRVSFTQKAVLIDDLTARLNSGPARLTGSVRLKDWKPEWLDLGARLAEMTVKIQEGLSCTLEEGTHLSLVGAPAEPTLSGLVIVARMKYTEDVNIERSLLDFTKRAPAPKALAKSDALVHFNVDVQLSRGVSIANNLARTDLKGEFTLTGTSRQRGLVGSINTLRGTAFFRGNEFQIEQGVINFTDRQSIRPSFDLQAWSQVKEYKVRLHAFGTPQDTRVSLTSEPALAEADLAFLLTFGFVQSNIQAGAVSASDTGAALALEALNKVTGFSDEVRRFIPKNVILRNPTIDFTSDFSIASNRVEPMARFHSQLLTERLDLKVLQGLSTRRGRGVVAYRLSDSITAQGQIDNEHIQFGTDFGIDLSIRWEGN